MNVLKCSNLSKNYGRTAALSSVDLELESGKIIGLLGPNGSGKTTFIKLRASHQKLRTAFSVRQGGFKGDLLPCVISSREDISERLDDSQGHD